MKADVDDNYRKQLQLESSWGDSFSQYLPDKNISLTGDANFFRLLLRYTLLERERPLLLQIWPILLTRGKL